MFCFLWINEAERRMTMPFTIYTFTIETVRLTAPKLALLNIEVKAEVVKKIMGVNNKNMKPATILLLKLCPEREKAKTFRMLNIAITKRRIINSCMPADILAPPGYLVNILYSNAKEGTPLNNFNKCNK